MICGKCQVHSAGTISWPLAGLNIARVVWQETSYGVLRPPLGSVRLTVIELVAVLLRTCSEEADAAIVASGVVRGILSVFLRFPFNSILHHQVRQPAAPSCNPLSTSL